MHDKELVPHVDPDALALHGSDAISAVAAARREAETVRVAMLTARNWPRDEDHCRSAALQAFTRPIVAEDAEYAYDRGGNEVRGISVYAAREIARHWRNIQYGMEIVSQDANEVHVRAFAWDLETNQKVTADDRFAKLQQRKDKRSGETRWVVPDERDLREIINKRGAILIRNCILQIVPSDLVEECIRQANTTLRAQMEAKKGDAKAEAQKAKQRTKLLEAFEKVGVTREQIEARLAHSYDELTPEEYVDLTKIGKALKDGQVQASEFFSVGAEVPGQTPTPQGEGEVESVSDLMGGDAPAGGDLFPKKDTGKEF